MNLDFLKQFDKTAKQDWCGCRRHCQCGWAGQVDKVHPDQVWSEVVKRESARWSLTRWLKKKNESETPPRYVNDDVERQWTSHKPEGKDTISWEEYRCQLGFRVSEVHLQMDLIYKVLKVKKCEIIAPIHTWLSLPTGKMSMVSLTKKMQRRRSMVSLTNRWRFEIQDGGQWLILITVENLIFRWQLSKFLWISLNYKLHLLGIFCFSSSRRCGAHERHCGSGDSGGHWQRWGWACKDWPDWLYWFLIPQLQNLAEIDLRRSTLTNTLGTCTGTRAGLMANMVLFTLYIVIPTSLSEPDWVASEREQFTQFRDTDGNGLMDLEEVKVMWFIPHAYMCNFSLCRHGLFHLILTTVKPKPSIWYLNLMLTVMVIWPRRKSWRSTTSSLAPRSVCTKHQIVQSLYFRRLTLERRSPVMMSSRNEISNLRR